MARCPDASALEELATGKLPAERRAELLAHLDGCQECAELVAELARLYGSTANPVDPALADTHLAMERGPAAPVARELGRYRVLRALGEGAMGVVFEAHDPELDRRIAIKLLHPQASEAVSSLRARLIHEARAMAKLAHPNVVTVFDVGRLGQQVFIAMELVEGTTLRRWLAEARPSQRQILDAFVQAGRGLEAAHQVGLVHRDFKPDNVLLGADGRVRVTDFGLARPHAGFAPAPLDIMRTAPGALVGTPAYMAPEQLRGEMADARSDQFSFCVAFYEALSGRRPFAGDSFAALAEEVARGRVLPLPAGTPRWLARVLSRGLAPLGRNRFGSMAELIGELTRDRGRARRMLLAAFAMIVGAAIIVGLLQWVNASVSSTPAASASDGPSACEVEAARVDQSWNDARRTELAKKLPEVAPGRGKDVAARVTRVFDSWAAQWKHQRKSVCETPLAAAGFTCLDERLRRFEALVSEVLAANITSAERALAAAEALPGADECAQEARLKGLQRPSGKNVEANAGRIELVRGDVARAYALAAMGKIIPARDTGAQALREAETLGDAQLTAEATLANGLIAWRRGETDRAAELCTKAAEMAGQGEVRSEAGLALVALLGAHQLRPADADRWTKLVQADAERYGDRELEARLAVHVGAMKRAIAEYEEAEKSLEHALELRRKRHGDQHPLVAAALLEDSALHLERDEPQKALERARLALGIFMEAAGKDDLRTAAAEAAVGRALVAQGKAEEALLHFKRALRVRLLSLPLGDDLETAESQADLGWAFEQLGRFEEARAEYRKSESRRRERPELALSLALQAGVAMREKKGADALKLHRGAVAHLETLYGKDDARLARALRGLGLAEAEVGSYPQARAALERALELTVTQLGYGAASGLVYVDLGRAARLAHRDADALHHFDDAYIWLVSGFGQYHPRARNNVLERADLAFGLGQREYAGRLYSTVAPELEKAFGADHPDTSRARERAVTQTK